MKQHDDYRPQARPRQTMSTGNLLLLLALLGWALPLTRTERTLAPSSAGARGEPGSPAADATARLKQAGHCDSLMQAMQAARYAVETAPAAPATGSDAGCYADNPAQALRCWFRAEGLEVQSAGTPAAPWKLNLRLRGYGRETLEVADAGTVSARQNRVELSHASGTVVEWYENQAAGLEQGFTMRNSPRVAGHYGSSWLRKATCGPNQS